MRQCFYQLFVINDSSLASYRLFSRIVFRSYIVIQNFGAGWNRNEALTRIQERSLCPKLIRHHEALAFNCSLCPLEANCTPRREKWPTRHGKQYFRLSRSGQCNETRSMRKDRTMEILRGICARFIADVTAPARP